VRIASTIVREALRALLLSAANLMRGRIFARLGLSFWFTAVCASVVATPACAQPKLEVLGAGFLSGFVDDLGRRVHRNTLQRPLRLVFFGYTSCPDVCPLTLLAVHQALEAFGSRANRIEPVFVTVDPDRDSVARLHSYVEAFDPRIRGYRANPSELDRLAQELGVQYQREEIPGSKEYGFSHTDTLFLLDRDGRVLARIYHYTDPTALGEEIVSAVRPVIGAGSSTKRGGSF